MRKAMHADPDNYVTSMAPGQYWTWGTHMKSMKGKIGRMILIVKKTAVFFVFIQPFFPQVIMFCSPRKGSHSAQMCCFNHFLTDLFFSCIKLFSLLTAIHLTLICISRMQMNVALLQ